MSTAPKMALSPTTVEATDQPADSVAAAAESGAPKHEEIAQLAYQYWESRGRPLGSPEEDWLRAEQDVLMDRLVWGGRPPHAPR
jgi:Protein of unknown function (DUF2934)